MEWNTSGFLASAMGGIATTVYGAGENLPGLQHLVAYLDSHLSGMPVGFILLRDELRKATNP